MVHFNVGHIFIAGEAALNCGAMSQHFSDIKKNILLTIYQLKAFLSDVIFSLLCVVGQTTFKSQCRFKEPCEPSFPIYGALIFIALLSSFFGNKAKTGIFA